MERYVVKVRTSYKNDWTDKNLLLPGIFTESGLLISHLRYLASNSSKSNSWMERSAFSIVLLIKYINANDRQFEDATGLLRSFTQCLISGTINPTTLRDESKLFWSGRSSEDAKSILFYITHYTDWLSEQPNHKNERVNPYRLATGSEQRLNWCAYYHKKAHVFLSHLWDDRCERQRNELVRDVRTPALSIVSGNSTKRFPEVEIRNLLDVGFKSRTINGISAPDYKNQAITLLMHYGGVRKSEIFHLYLSDILVDVERKEAIVRIYHPSEGRSPDPEYRNRREYLSREFRLKPRTEYFKSERLHAGWKAPLLTSQERYFQVHFFPPEMATEFLLVWRNYLKFQRVIPSKGYEHPYAFTNGKGRPETVKNFQRIHRDAVIRIGLEHSKSRGTTEHGHRHSYGYRLAEHGFSQLEIQKAMHHKNFESCLVYISPTDEDLRKKLRSVGL